MMFRFLKLVLLVIILAGAVLTDSWWVMLVIVAATARGYLVGVVDVAESEIDEAVQKALAHERANVSEQAQWN